MQGSREHPAGPVHRFRWAFLLLCGMALGNGCRRDAEVEPGSGSDRRAALAQAEWLAGIDTLQASVVRLTAGVTALDGTAQGIAVAQQRFREARLAFKAIEFIASYYEPTTTRQINGPALPEVEDEDGPESVFPPQGFQVIEERLFPTPDTTGRAELMQEVKNLEQLITRLRIAAAVQVVRDDRVWDAAQLEVARVMTLGISGFDSPVAFHSLPEAAAALRGVRLALAHYRPVGMRDTPQWAGLVAAFSRADQVLGQAQDFDAFDRYAFIVGQANPLARALDATRRALDLPLPAGQRAFLPSAGSIFDRGAIDPLGFAPPGTVPASPEQVALGKQLFFDARLSGDGTQACASCHLPARAFTDGLAKSVGHDGRATQRNAPTVLNAGLQVGSFYDLRTAYLEDQVTDVVSNPREMHGDLARAVVRLQRDPAYAALVPAGSSATRDAGAPVRRAIAAYIRSLSRLDAPADLALRGDTLAFTAEAREGFNLFMGKAKCGTCHFAPLYNGTAPPAYQDTDVEVLGVPASLRRGAPVDADPGRFAITRAAPHRFAFRTPTLRNIALTAPYMHNGVFRTLDEVIDFYDGGGGAGRGIRLDNQTLPPDSLHLAPREKAALIAFLRSLTDTSRTR